MSQEKPPKSQGKMIVFGGKHIRRVWHSERWFFSVVDVVGALTDSDNPRNYWNMMKAREKVGSGVELSTLCVQLKMPSSDGKYYKTDAVDTEAAFRIIQSIPSPKAEPFKRWLAEVGYERVQEIENPELAQQRMRKLYKAKGYSDEWIEKRIRGIAVRDELTDEWKSREVREQTEFAILTAEISKATFGVTPGQHRQIKQLKRENLRDHMTDLELIFTMLGEAATTEIVRNKDAKGFAPNKVAAREGGTVAGNARRQLEKKTGKKIVSRQNYLSNKSRRPLLEPPQE
jgi:hypothetical protein